MARQNAELGMSKRSDDKMKSVKLNDSEKKLVLDTLRVIAPFMAQTQAAAMAVLCADIRRCSTELNRRRGSESDSRTEEEKESTHLAEDILQELELAAINSLAGNDGEVVYHVGCAAKQMNPLLCAD